MSRRKRIALLGFGRIARSQHLPAIERSSEFELVAVVDPAARAVGLPSFNRLEGFWKPAWPWMPSRCASRRRCGTTPRGVALQAGLAVLLEKPPCATVAEVESLVERARRRSTHALRCLAFALRPGARSRTGWLANTKVQFASIRWREDVRQWHPGQRWIGAAGGLGVFDAGINALSLATRLLSSRLHVRDGHLYVPSNWATPIAASLELETGEGVPVQVELDWLGPANAEWDMRFVTDHGELRVSGGGAPLWIGGIERPLEPVSEYAGVYARFAELIERDEIDVDAIPLQIVADAFLRCRRERVQPFIDDEPLTPRGLNDAGARVP